MAKQIYGQGNPLLDISANVDDAFLKKYDLQPANAVLAEDKHMPLYKELEATEGCVYIPGGATLNSIRVAQWMLGGADNKVTHYAGCVGKDTYGETLKNGAAAEGVNMVLQVDPETPTGTCGVCVVGKERSLVANLAAANKLNMDHMATDAVKAAYAAAGVYYSAGFHLTVCPDAMVEVGKHAAETDKIYTLNLSAPFIIQFFADPLKKITPYADIIFCNDDEAKAYGSEGQSLEDVATTLVNLEKVNTKRDRIVCITRGDKSTIVAEKKDGKVVTHEVDVPAVPADEITDTNGAGDAFVGGFLSQLAQGKDIDTCCKAGHYAAGQIIRRSGCTFPAKPEFTA
jgi:adenosine kinase